MRDARTAIQIGAAEGFHPVLGQNQRQVIALIPHHNTD
jgi:hypothetical protein